MAICAVSYCCSSNLIPTQPRPRPRPRPPVYQYLYVHVPPHCNSPKCWLPHFDCIHEIRAWFGYLLECGVSVAAGTRKLHYIFMPHWQLLSSVLTTHTHTHTLPAPTHPHTHIVGRSHLRSVLVSGQQSRLRCVLLGCVGVWPLIALLITKIGRAHTVAKPSGVKWNFQFYCVAAYQSI